MRVGKNISTSPHHYMQTVEKTESMQHMEEKKKENVYTVCIGSCDIERENNFP